MFKELDVVELTHPIKEYNLNRGNRGAIVQIYNDSEAYGVEFVARNGKTIVLLVLKQPDIQPIHKEKTN